MKRTEIQKAIIPRNWLFGRLAGINNNLRGILNQKNNLTPFEILDLEKARELISGVLVNKKHNSDQLKLRIRIKNRKKNESSE